MQLRLVNVQQQELGGMEGEQLAANLATDAPARASDQYPAPRHHRLDRPAVDLHHLPAEE